MGSPSTQYYTQYSTIFGGESYTLSFYARDCLNTDTFSITGATPAPLKPGADWVRYSLAYTYPVDHKPPIYQQDTLNCTPNLQGAEP